MTGITGAETPCSTETVPTACGSADKQRDRSRCRKPFPHWADRLYRIRVDPSDRGLFASATHRLMDADDIRVSVEQTEARIIGHESHGHDIPPGTPGGHGIVSGGVRESNPHHQLGRLRH